MKRKNIKSSDMQLALILMSDFALNNAVINNPDVENNHKLKQQCIGENRIIKKVLSILMKGIENDWFDGHLEQLDKYINSIDYIDKIDYDEILTSNYRYKYLRELMK